MKAPHKILWIRMILCALTGGFLFRKYIWCNSCLRMVPYDHDHEEWNKHSELRGMRYEFDDE